MKKGIVVCTWSGGRKYADLCIDSLMPLYGRYEFYIVINDVYKADPEWVNLLGQYFNVIGLAGDFRELGAIQAIRDNTDLDEFWFFQDTMEILDHQFITSSLDHYEGQTVSYHLAPMQFYLGKWRTCILKKLNFPPLPKNKTEAIDYESGLALSYMKAESSDQNGLIIIDASMENDGSENYLETIFGEERLVMVGKYLRKRMSLEFENFGGLDKDANWRNHWKK